jgi:hypothetical protein
VNKRRQLQVIRALPMERWFKAALVRYVKRGLKEGNRVRQHLSDLFR